MKLIILNIILFKLGKFFSDLDFEDKLAFKKILKMHQNNVYVHNKFVKKERI